MRKPRLASGLKPYTKAERRKLARETSRATLPKCAVEIQRLLATCEALEARLRESRTQIEQQPLIVQLKGVSA